MRNAPDLSSPEEVCALVKIGLSRMKQWAEADPARYRWLCDMHSQEVVACLADKREGTVVSPSSNHGCPLELWYALNGEAGAPLPGDVYAKFLLGNAVHHIIRTALYAAQAAVGTFELAVEVAIYADWEWYQGRKVTGTEHYGIGTADALLWTPGQTLLLDIKSTTSYAISRHASTNYLDFKADAMGYGSQIALYTTALSESDAWSLEDIHGGLLAVNKQTASGLACVIYSAAELAEVVEQRIRPWHEAKEKPEPLRKIECGDDNFFCRNYCKFAGICPTV